MSDEHCTFEQTRVRLDEILVQVKRKDTSLEQSLELLEEGVRLANLCNELIDQTSWRAPDGEDTPGGDDADPQPCADDVAEASEEASADIEDDERA